MLAPVASGFEVEWLKLLRHAPLPALAERYTLIVAPSSSPYNLINFVFPGLSGRLVASNLVGPPSRQRSLTETDLRTSSLVGPESAQTCQRF